MTVSLRPRSAGSGGRAGPPSNGCRSTTLNCTSWMWIGCASSVKLWISQTSTESSAGFSVIGSIHCSDVAVPSGLTVPSSASRGPTSGSTSEPASLSETLRTLPAGAGRSEKHTSELQSPVHLVCRLLLEKKKQKRKKILIKKKKKNKKKKKKNKYKI